MGLLDAFIEEDKKASTPEERSRNFEAAFAKLINEDTGEFNALATVADMPAPNMPKSPVQPHQYLLQAHPISPVQIGGGLMSAPVPTIESYQGGSGGGKDKFMQMMKMMMGG